MDKAHWADVTWANIKANYPSARILQSGQNFETPNSWDNTVNSSYIVENFSD